MLIRELQVQKKSKKNIRKMDEDLIHLLIKCIVNEISLEELQFMVYMYN